MGFVVDGVGGARRFCEGFGAIELFVTGGGDDGGGSEGGGDLEAEEGDSAGALEEDGLV